MSLFCWRACSATDTSRSTGEFTDDAAITARVKLALADDEKVSALDVKVDTFREVVQLTGFTESRDIANRAATVARGVEGVKEVRNDIQLRPK